MLVRLAWLLRALVHLGSESELETPFVSEPFWLPLILWGLASLNHLDRAGSPLYRCTPSDRASVGELCLSMPWWPWVIRRPSIRPSVHSASLAWLSHPMLERHWYIGERDVWPRRLELLMDHSRPSLAARCFIGILHCDPSSTREASAPGWSQVYVELRHRCCNPRVPSFSLPPCLWPALPWCSEGSETRTGVPRCLSFFGGVLP